ncbi:MAG TPA: hypothetical protein VN227_07215 [Methanoregula sp.]|jgi:hypothetical protein|nr:hypothetical protein [Methanoregula sp.]
MADATDPDTYPDTIWYPVERYLLGFAVRDKVRLISTLISIALLNELVKEFLQKHHFFTEIDKPGLFKRRPVMSR